VNNALLAEVDNHMILSSYTVSTNSFYHRRKVTGGQPSVEQLSEEKLLVRDHKLYVTQQLLIKVHILIELSIKFILTCLEQAKLVISYILQILE